MLQRLLQMFSKTKPPIMSTLPPVQQSPNRVTTWTESQAQRPGIGTYGDARFEQSIQSLQPNPAAAIELISQEPIRLVESRRVYCDGGGGALGHPKVYINLDKPGPRVCIYCGLRFQQQHHH